MIEKIQYVNHLNESLEFGKGRLYVNANDLRDFTWSFTGKNDRISGFKKGIVTKTIPVVLKADSEEEGFALRNRLFEVAEKDVLAVKHGRITIGDYYLKCFVTESKKSEYLINKGYMRISLKVTTDFPFWIKEKTTNFFHGQASESKQLDYNRNYPYDYTSNMLGKQLINDDIVASNFRLVFYGACVNPAVVIGGHLYSVNTSVEAGEFLAVDSVQKTVVLMHKDGSTTNCFNLRSRDSYIFEKIPQGTSVVSTSSAFKLDVTLLEERSEPKWT